MTNLKSLAASAFVLLIAVPFTRAAQPGIKDDAHLFKPETIQQAQAVIDDVQQKYSKQVVIETFPSIPADLQSKFQSSDKSRFYREWGYNRARDLNVTGLYILIVKDPGHLEVEIGKNTRKSAFTDSDGRRLSDTMLASFKTKDFDKGLVDGVQFIRERFAANLGSSSGATNQTSGSNSSNPLPGPLDTGTPRSPSPAPSPRTYPPVTQQNPGSPGFGFGSWLCIGIAVLGFFLIVKAMRTFRGGGRGGGYVPPMGGGGYGGGGGGGGFGRGMMGGVLGGLFGNWIGNQWSNRNRDDTGGHFGGGNFPDNSGGPSSFGGSSSSGGDFGGGGSDAGGGGGSDFGGGGDFGGSSSSGGDF